MMGHKHRVQHRALSGIWIRPGR